MKRTLLTLSATGLLLSSLAQNPFNQAAVNDKTVLTGFEVLPIHPSEIEMNGNRIISDSLIGETFYDLQTNASTQNRALRHTDGTSAGVWTFSSETGPAFTDRGTNYNYFDGSAWEPIGYNRIENERTGWPSLITTAAGKEMTFAHSSAMHIAISYRATKGTGAWSYDTLPSNAGGIFWPRVAVGGASGNAIHLIALTVPVGNGGTPYAGLDGALLYFRSLDEGVTWDIQDSLLPGMDDSLVFSGFRADSYSIISEGDNVAITVYNQWGDSFVMKSTDNGDNWTYLPVFDFPIDDFVADMGSDADNNGSFDTLFTTDEAGATIFDDNGMVHVFYGNMRVLDADTTDGNTSYFPGTSGLMHWMEGMLPGSADTIADVEDVDGDQQIFWAGDWALYYTSLTSHPSVGKNNDGTIFLTYMGYREDIAFNSSQNHRHIYAMKSTDNGATWNQPVDVTPDPFLNGWECVFPHVAPWVDDKLRFWFQQDYEPGLAVRGDMDPVNLNEIIWVEVDTILGLSVGVDEVPTNLSYFNLYPNPTNDQLTIELGVQDETQVNIFVTDVLGRKVMTVGTSQNVYGISRQDISVAHLPSGLYNVIIESGNERLTKRLIRSK